MAVNSSDIGLNYPEVIDDTTSNGGKRTDNVVVSGAIANGFPNVSSSERLNGVVRARKFFLHLFNTDNSPLINTKILLYGTSPAGDYYKLYDADNEGVVAGDGSTLTSNAYASGNLSTALTGGSSTSIAVSCEYDGSTLGDDDGFSHGFVAVIEGGVVEFVEIDAATRSWSGNTVTLPIKSTYNGTGKISQSFATSAVVSAYIDAGTIQATVDNFVGNNIDSSQVLVQNLGCVEDSWTITFTSATEYTISSTKYLYNEAGNISTQKVINNASTGTPALTIEPTFFTASDYTGETITFDTHHAAFPFAVKEIVPAGTGSFAGNSISCRVYGESA
jgi:hypothetical protein